MTNETNLPQMFYDVDIIAIRKGLLDIDFFRAFSKPAVFSTLASASAVFLDDYAADVLICKQDSLAWVPSCATQMDLPCAWLRGDAFLGLTRDSKRAIHCCLLTPSAEELGELTEAYKKAGLELNAVFALLGLPMEAAGIRLLSLITLPEVLEEYHRLYLITSEEYERLTQLQRSPAIQ